MYTISDIKVGCIYSDAFGGGRITAVSPEAYEGRHQGMFAYADNAGSKGFVMLMSLALERLNCGDATLCASVLDVTTAALS